MSTRRRKTGQNHMIGELFTFALFGLFLILSLLIVVIGVNGYRNVVSAGEAIGDVRTTLGYVAGKVRSEAALDGVRIDEKEGTPVLVLSETYEGTSYETLIYHQDGALYEAYIDPTQLDFTPDVGSRLSEIADFDMAWDAENLLALTATSSSGKTQTLHIAIRGGQEVTAP